MKGYLELGGERGGEDKMVPNEIRNLFFQLVSRELKLFILLYMEKQNSI